MLRGAGVRRVAGKRAVCWSMELERRGLAEAAGKGRKRRPAGYWQEKGNRLAFMEAVAQELGIKEDHDWQKVTYDTLVGMGGGTLLKQYGGSVQEALRDLFPALDLRAARKTAAHGHWDAKENQREFVRALGERHGVATAADWKHVSAQDVTAAGGATLLSKFGGSLQEMLAATYDGEGQLERPKRQRNHWKSAEKRRAFVESFAKERCLREPEDWVHITREDLEEAGGRSLMRSYYPTVSALLQDVYGGKDEAARKKWAPAMCRPSVGSDDISSDPASVKAILERAKRQLQLAEETDWYRVSHRQLCTVPGGQRLLRTVGLAKALEMAYPKVQWNRDLCTSTTAKKSSQRHLRLLLHSLTGAGDASIQEPAVAESL